MLAKQFPVRPAIDPFLVVLTKQGQSWEEAIKPGRDEDEMFRRLMSIDLVSQKTKEETYKDKWKVRRRGKRDKPRYHEHGTVPGHGNRPVHMPIIMQEEESIRFLGPAPFFVMIIPEPEVQQVGTTNPFVGALDPNVPFCEYAQFDSAAGQYFVQKQVRRGDDVVNQLFMKMIFVIIDDGDPKIADPDFICDR